MNAHQVVCVCGRIYPNAVVHHCEAEAHEDVAQ
jgi:hypothetical protein